MKNTAILFFLFMVFAVSGSLMGQEQSTAGQTSSNPFSQYKYVPDISFVLDMSGVYRTLGNDPYKNLKMRGFTGDNLNEFNKRVGFNLNYGELGLYEAVDPYFELTGIFSFGLEGVEIEEAFINTSALPYGFGIKAGKFKSSFGRLNAQHEHVWDFSDRPIIYQAVFGADGLSEVGAQLTWVAPVDTYLLLGGEALQGVNEQSFGNESFHDPTYVYRISGSKGPNAYVGFLTSSIDAGDWSILYGFSGAYGTTRSFENLTDVGIGNIDTETAFYGNIARGIRGNTWIAGGDLTIKYLINSYQYVSFQGEYIRRFTTGSYYYTLVDPASGEILTYKLPYDKQISGMYAQLVVKPFQRWRFGGRFELLHLDRYHLASHTVNSPDNLIKASGMIDFSPTEFSRLRLQYNHDRSGYDRYNSRRINNEVILQATVAMGAHGAHPY
jgi:hypothetical protein